MFPGRVTRYVMAQIVGGVALALTIIMVMIVLVDFVELSRTLGSAAPVSPIRLMLFALMRAPSLIETTLPFIFLFGVMWAMFRLNRRSELVVMRAAGMSAWRFIAPAVMIAIIAGGISATLVNPAAARLSAEYERRRADLLNPVAGAVDLSEGGVWLREARDNGQLVIRAERAEAGGRRLINATLYFYDHDLDGRPLFSRRIDAARAVLRAGFWQLTEAWETAPNLPPERHDSVAIPTALAAEGLLETYGAPETLSFWDLRRQSELLREAGFQAASFELRWHRLLALPLTLTAMTLVAAAASLRLARRGGAFQLAATGAAVGFVLFFAENFLAAFGRTGVLPIALAAWAAPAFTLLGGLYVIALAEDG